MARKEVRHVATEEGCGVVPCRKKSGEMLVHLLPAELRVEHALERVVVLGGGFLLLALLLPLLK